MAKWMKIQRNLAKVVSLWFCAAVMPAHAVNVSVSIPPLAGMIAPLLDKDDRLTVLLEPGVSPHGFQLKPSHLFTLQNSDLIVSVGTPVDSWLHKAAQRYPEANVAMAQLQAVEKLPVREGGVWQHKHHERHEDEGAGNHADAHDHAGHGHAVLHFDGHLWMSPNNARALILAVSEKLQRLKTQQAGSIQARTQAWLAHLEQTDVQLMQQLQPYRQAPYLVLHDAYQYFEKHYHLNGVGSITLNPEITPSLKRVQNLRRAMTEGEVRCVFKEPQFPEKRVSAVVSGLNVRIGNLDPMGVYDAAGQRVEVVYRPYDEWLLQLGAAFESCLKPE
ncbi:zinc ABC transporter substrate-binding protein [Thiomicrorhabdus cannonii]|uniref:zinc ABC transporter substrate-binding protein n=1 Tax=Thiomicrorhabdus cannonii TaxID=2748011 RepID=UPI0015B83931|nr:zinc ABC transporter substrate-binding protein [Thiomicrorhabdus cannonii]